MDEAANIRPTPEQSASKSQGLDMPLNRSAPNAGSLRGCQVTRAWVSFEVGRSRDHCRQGSDK